MSHANAPLSPTGRLRLARCIVDQEWPLRRAADRFGCSPTTAQRWAIRYRQFGKDAMVDRSSRPRRCAGQLDRRTERRIMGLRVSRRWGPARIGYRLGLNPSTVHKVLRRYNAPPLAWTDPATGCRLRAKPKARRYEHDAPGDLVHVDVKKLGRIPDGGGHRVHGRAKGQPDQEGHQGRARRSFTTPLMTTPDWRTARSWLMRRRRPPARSGNAQAPGSPAAGSACNGC